jgi:hypothetical protein
MQIKINLTKLTGACVRTLKGASGNEKQCIIIPLDSGLVMQDGKVYIIAQAFELTNKKGQSHFLKRKIEPEERLNYNDLQVIGGITE